MTGNISSWWGWRANRILTCCPWDGQLLWKLPQFSIKLLTHSSPLTPCNPTPRVHPEVEACPERTGAGRCPEAWHTAASRWEAPACSPPGVDEPAAALPGGEQEFVTKGVSLRVRATGTQGSFRSILTSTEARRRGGPAVGPVLQSSTTSGTTLRWWDQAKPVLAGKGPDWRVLRFVPYGVQICPNQPNSTFMGASHCTCHTSVSHTGERSDLKAPTHKCTPTPRRLQGRIGAGWSQLCRKGTRRHDPIVLGPGAPSGPPAAVSALLPRVRGRTQDQITGVAFRTEWIQQNTSDAVEILGLVF